MDSTTEGLTIPVPENATGAALLCRLPFYVTGGTLSPSATSYVERDADAALVSALECGEFCYVLNTRQMGKSSLMARAASRLRDGGVSVAVLDLTALGQNLSVAQWYHGLLVSVGEQLGLEDAAEDHWRRHAEAGPLQRFLGALRDVALPTVPGALVLFIDEIDAVRSLPFPTGELFAGIRELHNRRTQDPALNRLTFCLLGVATPADLIRDTRTTPFNIGARIGLDDFTPAEAAPLAQGMFGGRAVLGRVLHWTGGHPYLTQRLCRAIADDPQAVTKPAQVDALCERLFFCPSARDTEDNLLFVRERVLRSDPDPAALLTLYARVLRGRTAVIDDPADPLASALKLAGVVKADASGRLRVRNRIYARVFGRNWVRENMPGAEVRRQRRAFRRGALRVGLIGAVLIAVIGTLAGVAVKEAHVARAANQKAQGEATKLEKLLYVSDMQNAQSAWDDGNLGRLRDLLAQTKNSPERGFEWGYWNRLAYPPGEVVQVSRAPLTACATTQDGSRLVTAGGDGVLCVWNAHTLRPIYKVRYPGPAIISTAFSQDGSRWLANDQSGGLVIYDTQSGRRLFSLPPNQPGFVSYTSIDLKFAVHHVHDAAATFLNCDTGKTVGVMPHRGGGTYGSASDTAANTHDTVFWFDNHPFTAGVYNLTNGKCICHLQLPPRLQSPVEMDGTFSGDDRTLVTRSYPTCDCDLWDAASGRLIRHLDNIPFAHDSFFLTDRYAPLALLRDNARLRVYSTRTGQQILNCPYPETSGELSPSAFSYDGRYLSLVGASGAVFLLDCKTGKSAGTYLGHEAASVSAAFLARQGQFVSISTDGSLRRWNKSNANQQETWHTVRFPKNVAYDFMEMLRGHSRAVMWQNAIRPKVVGQTLWGIAADRARRIRTLGVGDHEVFLNANDASLTLWGDSGGPYTEYDVGDGHIIGRWHVDNSHSPAAAVSPDGRCLAATSKFGLTSVFDMGRRGPQWSARGSNSLVNVMAFSPSGDLVASGGAERVVDVWEARTGRKIASLSGSTGDALALTILQGDRRLVAVCPDQTLRCWDIASGRLLWTARTTRIAWPFHLRQTPDGRRVLMASPDGFVSLWDAETGDRLLKINSNGRASDARFSPDSRTLELSNSVGGYGNYAADMRPHDGPATDAAAP